MLTRSSIRAVVFDLDNTLYPYAPCHEAGMQRAARVFAAWPVASPRSFRAAYLAARRVVARRHLHTASSHSRLLYFRHLCERAFRRPAIQEALTLHHAYWDGYLSAMTLEPDAKPLLQSLRRRGVKIGLLTDLTEEIQLRKVMAVGLADAVDAVVTSEEIGREKPAPEVFRAILRKLREPPRHSVMVGDDYRKDIVGGKRLGFTTVWVSDHHTGRRPRAADLVVADVGALRGWL